MNTNNKYLRYVCLLSITQCCLWHAVGASVSELKASVPTTVEAGFRLLKAAGPMAAFDAWSESRVWHESAEPSRAANEFQEMAKLFRNFRTYEVIAMKEIGTTSKILYVSMSFERGVLYGSFLVWKSDRDWRIQNLEFNSKPEVIMPWLALAGGP